MNNSGSNWIKVYIIDVLPGIAVALYVLGFLYNEMFYSVFGIDVEHYISLSEMLIDIMIPLIFIVIFYTLMIINFYYGIYQNTLPVIRQALDKNIQKYKEKEGDKSEIYKLFIKKNNRLLKYLFISTILPLALFIGVSEIKGNISIGPNMMVAFSFCFLILLLFAPLFILSTPRPYRSIMILETVVALYIFAAIVFGYSGYKDGKYIKEYDTVQFEIKTSDGSIFDNNAYRFINQTNDRVFILEKSTKKTVVICNDGIIYLKLNRPNNRK